MLKFKTSDRLVKETELLKKIQEIIHDHDEDISADDDEGISADDDEDILADDDDDCDDL